MLKNLTIKSRLIFLVTFLCLALMAIGLNGLMNLGATNAAVKTIYEDRVIALGQLGEIRAMTDRNQRAMASALTADPKEFPKIVDDMAIRSAKINEVLKAYLGTYLTPTEKILAQKYTEFRQKYREGGSGLFTAALKAGDVEKAKTAFRGPTFELYGPVEKTLDELIQLQIDVSKQEYDHSQERFDTARMVSIAAIIFGLLVGISIAVWLVRSIVSSLQQAVRIAESVAEGDLTQKVEIHSNDEIGKLLLALRTMNGKLTGIVRQVRLGTDTIATASSQIAAGNLDLSSRTEQQASSLEETASSMEELTATVKQNADNARQANAMATTAKDVAVQGGEAVAQVVETMESIRNSSRKVADIISVIDGIAFQTNILALNAAVEAARAGEQGRGFAVVATEVRTLAQRSAAAAKEIKSLIDDSVLKVNAGTEQVANAGRTMQEIVESVAKVTDVMDEIMHATQEQSAGIGQVNQAVGQMDQVTQQNAALVEEAAAAAQSLQEQARNLAQEVSIFRIEDSVSGQMIAPSLKTNSTFSVPMRPTAKNTSLTVAPTVRPTAHASNSNGEWEEF